MGTKIIYTDDIHIVGELFDSDGEAGSPGKSLVATATGSTWQDTPAGTPVLLTTAILNGITVTNNQTMTAVNCFGSQDLSSGPSWTSSSSSITIPENGFYTISFAITTTSTGTFNADVWTLTVNTNSIGEESSIALKPNSAMFSSTGINEAGAVLTTTLQLVANDVLGLASRREGTNTTSGTTVGSKSSFSIQRIGQPATTTGTATSAESSEATRNIIIGTSATPPTISGVFENTIYFQREA
jgi:hypothetical protein